VKERGSRGREQNGQLLHCPGFEVEKYSRLLVGAVQTRQQDQGTCTLRPDAASRASETTVDGGQQQRQSTDARERKKAETTLDG
jgi:hypothetical protein